MSATLTHSQCGEGMPEAPEAKAAVQEFLGCGTGMADA